MILPLTLFLIPVACWDLSDFGINENYYVSSVAIYRNRAFLALPRTACSNNITSPTAVEVSWLEDINTNIFGIRKKLFTIESQKWNHCKDLQNAISLDVEPKKPKLWVLDKGNENCPAKLLTYNLFHNSISQICKLGEIPRKNLNIFVIDPIIGDYGPRAYIGDAGDNTLLVFSLNELKWWRLNLRETNDPPQTISASFLAVSKIDSYLFLTGLDSLDVYSLDLDEIRNFEGPLAIDAKEAIIQTNVTNVGKKLGQSSGLEADYKGGLNYYLIRDYAIVRWEIGQPFEAEYHNVLGQSFESFPYVSSLFTGPQNGVWALVNPFGPDQCQVLNKCQIKLVKMCLC